jgi:hypothetical protein
VGWGGERLGTPVGTWTRRNLCDAASGQSTCGETWGHRGRAGTRSASGLVGGIGTCEGVGGRAKIGRGTGVRWDSGSREQCVFSIFC